MGTRLLRFSPDVRMDPSAPAAACMVEDVAMLVATSLATGPAARVYEWARPAISLGRSNNAGLLNMKVLREGGVELVRRPTGGAVLVHGTDLSMSIALPRAALPAGGHLLEIGRLLARPVCEALRQLGLPAEFRSWPAGGSSDAAGAAGGLPLCFLQSSGLDILVDGYKVAAFAQRRTAGVIFQHGSVLVDPVPESVRDVLRSAGVGTFGDWREVERRVRPVRLLAPLMAHDLKRIMVMAVERLLALYQCDYGTGNTRFLASPGAGSVPNQSLRLGSGLETWN